MQVDLSVKRYDSECSILLRLAVNADDKESFLNFLRTRSGVCGWEALSEAPRRRPKSFQSKGPTFSISGSDIN